MLRRENIIGRIALAISTLIALSLAAEAQITWTARSSGTTELMSGVTFGNGRWVAVGEEGTILTSTDAASWSAATSWRHRSR